MPRPCPLPSRAAVRDLLSDLLGRVVAVSDAPAQQLDPERPAVLAAYRRDDGGVGAACVVDAVLATSAGAAIGMLPAATGESAFEGDVAEFFHEVVNVMAKLFNSPLTPHVVLREVQQVPGEVPQEVAALVLKPSARQDYRVRVDGYGEGGLTLLSG